MNEIITNDEIRPVCQKCGEGDFIAYLNGYVSNTEQAIAMIVCKNTSCNAVIGVLPKAEVFPNH